MKSFIKMSLTLIGLFLVACGIAGMLLFTRCTDFAKGYAARSLSKAMGVEVEIGQFGILPFGNGVELRDIAIKNPPGFKETAALHCDRIFVEMDPRTFFAETLLISQVRVTGLVLDLRMKPGESNNINVLTRNVAAAIPEEPTPEERANPPRVQVKEVIVEQSKVRVLASSLPLAIPDFTHHPRPDGRKTGIRVLLGVLKGLMEAVPLL